MTVELAYRTTPADRIGIALPDVRTVDELLAASKTNFRVGYAPLGTIADNALNGEPMVTGRIASHKATVREDTGKVLGIVGSGWTAVQNDEVAAFALALRDQTDGAQFIRGGTTHDSARATYMLRVGEPMLRELGSIEKRMVVYNGHDGTMAFRVLFYTVRLTCLNGATINVPGATRQIVFRHTVSVARRVAEAHNTFLKAGAYFDGAARFITALAGKGMTDETFMQVLHSLIPMPKDATTEQREKVAGRRQAVLSLYRTSNTVDRGTAWGGFNAFTEWLDHAKDTTARTNNESRATSELVGVTATLKAHAADLFLGVGN